ncbi:MAG: hypothetical protein AMDU1_APLC00017G0048 [Thermoplasmatales archaeon A-plasma]|jgi:GTPase SAR1 family protein|nr:MAG: hypothetical protein AMDU1_APLC00017G0048 [Thermoplasmatales archaeon A-plasma]
MIGSLFVTGPAGTGKSTFCAAYKDWLISNGYDAAIVNLDPGSEYIPYEAEIDIRETVSLSQIMSEYNLGPNGAQIVAADLLLENTEPVTKVLRELEDYYVIFDTPGQIELFSFRPGSPMLVDRLSNGKAMIAFIADAVLSASPSGFISQKMLFGSVLSRFYKPMLFVLNKLDLITDDDLEAVMRWEDSPDLLRDALMDEKQEMVKDYFSAVLNAFKESQMVNRIFPVSARDMYGFEDVYSEMSLFFTGGSDTDTMYRDD